MAKKKSKAQPKAKAKVEKSADNRDAEIAKLKDRIGELTEQLSQAQNRQLEQDYEADSANEARVYGYDRMIAEHQPIVVEEVAAVIPLLKDINGSIIDEHNWGVLMPELAERAVQTVILIRQKIAEATGESLGPVVGDPDETENLEG